MRAKFGRGPTFVSEKGSLKFISRPLDGCSAVAMDSPKEDTLPVFLIIMGDQTEVMPWHIICGGSFSHGSSAVEFAKRGHSSAPGSSPGRTLFHSFSLGWVLFWATIPQTYPPHVDLMKCPQFESPTQIYRPRRMLHELCPRNCIT